MPSAAAPFKGGTVIRLRYKKLAKNFGAYRNVCYQNASLYQSMLPKCLQIDDSGANTIVVGNLVPAGEVISQSRDSYQ